MTNNNLVTSKPDIIKLVLKGLILIDYDWSDVEKGRIQNLSFDYLCNNGTKGTINLGNVIIDMYEDCGDVCVDIAEGLYVLSNEFTEYFEDFLKIDSGLTLKDIPLVTTTFNWDDFYDNLAKYYED